jgi:transketolase
MNENELELKCINTIRFLSVDAVQKANSGHPGMPMGAASMAHTLWTEFLNHNPEDPHWANRDRFILSAGHGCMLLYSLLHLTGYKVSMDDLKNFRQLGSITPGHPEYGLTPGVEVTTGPLGQGFANAVGMAIAQKYLAARYNKPGFPIFDYNVYVICSDGDLMEGISSEAGSLAGHLKLDNLVYLYDDNHISIDGDTNLAFTENTIERFQGFGWHVQVVENGNNTAAIKEAIAEAKQHSRAPSIIKVRTNIGFGSPNKQDTASAHGAPLGDDEVKLAKEKLGGDPNQYFYVPDEVSRFYRKAVEEGKGKQSTWNAMFASYKEQYPELAAEYEAMSRGEYSINWDEVLPEYSSSDDALASRKASGAVINAIAEHLPNLVGGSADLAPSNNTLINSSSDFQHLGYENRNIRFGVREHAMGAILNGMALTKGIIPFGGTFLIFSDYMKPAIRLAAIMKIRSIQVFTHDSIGLGEDGTTHQPIEQLASLRSIPNVTVIRPADANETAQAWKVAIEHQDGPVSLILTRQGLPNIEYEQNGPEMLAKGAYVLRDTNDSPEVCLLATGSEVSLALQAQQQLKEEGIHSRVVSMPSWELFNKQDDDYKESVLPSRISKRVAVEAASPFGWHQYVGTEGRVIAMHEFGESGKGGDLMKHFGFTPENVVKVVKEML